MPDARVDRSAAGDVWLTAAVWQKSGRRFFWRTGAPTSVADVGLDEEQPTRHEIGNRTYVVADVAPLDVDGVRTVEVGTVLWLVGFLGLVPFYGTLADSGRTWWLWTCLAGLGLGLFGIDHCRRRRKARAQRQPS